MQVVAVKPDGGLERFTTTIITKDKVKCVQFTTTHFSPYAIVYTTNNNFNAMASAVNARTLVTNARDMPKTGDTDVFRIIIAAILFIAGCIEIISSIPNKKKVRIVSDEETKTGEDGNN